MVDGVEIARAPVVLPEVRVGWRVVELRAPDARTFVIELERPSHVFPMALALGSAAVKPRDLVQRYGKDFIHHLTGTGPYRVAT